MNTWEITEVEEIFYIKGRGALITFIPAKNGIKFDKVYPFASGDILKCEGKEHKILGIERFPKSFNTDAEPFGFLINDL